MICVDNGYLIALAIPRDSLHERALLWSEHVGEPLVLTEYVLWETMNVLDQAVCFRPVCQWRKIIEKSTCV
jgi:hypothetical protein